MSEPHDPFLFDADFGDPEPVMSAGDPNVAPRTGAEWEKNGRAADVPMRALTGQLSTPEGAARSGSPAGPRRSLTLRQQVEDLGTLAPAGRRAAALRRLCR